MMNVRHSSLIPNDPATTVLKSVCRSCHGGCGALLHVRDGVLVKVEGDPDSPLNHGRLCPIGTVTTDLVYHKDRLKYPMRRKGKRQSGEWERISWDVALDEISERVSPSATDTGRRRSRSAPARAAIISAGCHASVMRSARRTGASRACPVFSPKGKHLDPDLRRLPGERLHRRCAAGLHPVLGS